MKKNKLSFPEFKEGDLAKVEYNGITILVQPYISFSQQQALIVKYLEEYFNPFFNAMAGVPFDYLSAEEILKINVIDLCTNSKVFEDEKGLKPSFSIDDLISRPDLWENIRGKIKNFNEFYSRLQHIVAERRSERELQKSLGSILDTAIDKLTEVLNKLSTLNLTDKDKENIKETLEAVNNSEVMKILADKVK